MISLYIKTHNKTGMKYFGKTTKNPHTYKGSGKIWKRHIAKYGYDVTTEVVGQFLCQDECTAYALALSEELDIVNSPDYANLIPENGLDGAPIGSAGYRDFTDQQRIEATERSLNMWKCPEFKAMIASRWTEQRRMESSIRLKESLSAPEKRAEISKRFKDIPLTQEHRNSISKSLIGRVKSEAHRESLAMSRILKFNPEFQYKTYSEFRDECVRLYGLGNSIRGISMQLDVGWGAVKAAVISNTYLLKEE